jgi:DNA invertase Pin-like site-specific DNA recombinase
MESLKAAGAEKVFAEKIGGAAKDRKQLARLLAALQPDDTMIVTALDRLARSTHDLLNILDQIDPGPDRQEGREVQVTLAESWCNTSTPIGELLITVIGGIASFERHLIRKRTREGRA